MHSWASFIDTCETVTMVKLNIIITPNVSLPLYSSPPLPTSPLPPPQKNAGLLSIIIDQFKLFIKKEERVAKANSEDP